MKISKIHEKNIRGLNPLHTQGGSLIKEREMRELEEEEKGSSWGFGKEEKRMKKRKKEEKGSGEDDLVTPTMEIRERKRDCRERRRAARGGRSPVGVRGEFKSPTTVVPPPSEHRKAPRASPCV